jgi:hypothetical protein
VSCSSQTLVPLLGPATGEEGFRRGLNLNLTLEVLNQLADALGELLARAQELEGQMMNDLDDDAERLPEIEATTDDFDVDALFAGLLER